jgi:hypothetical protein
MQGRANGDCAVGTLSRVAERSSQWILAVADSRLAEYIRMVVSF